jgi:hypothetical protein
MTMEKAQKQTVQVARKNIPSSMGLSVSSISSMKLKSRITLKLRHLNALFPVKCIKGAVISQ